jgi:antitoxin component of MazEF toxin-antitoxin module
MEIFETKLKQWGNSLGTTIPRDIIERENLSDDSEVPIFVVGKKRQENLIKSFGTLKCDKPTQEIMDEINEGYE